MSLHIKIKATDKNKQGSKDSKRDARTMWIDAPLLATILLEIRSGRSRFELIVLRRP